MRADYWKSNERKYCDFCKCWIADNKPSIQFHENGKRHKANVAKRITEISKKSAKDEKAKQKFDQDIRKMEDAAMKAYMKDCSQYGDMSSPAVGQVSDGNADDTGYGFKTVTESGEAITYAPKVDPMLKGLPEDFHEDDNLRIRNKNNASLRGKGVPGNGGSNNCAATAKAIEAENSMWCEAVTDEGNTYYWNVKTNESVWEPPKEGYMTLKEYNKINEQAIKQQEEHLRNESKNSIQNADEIAAKFNRENLKKYRSKTNKINTDNEENELDRYKRDPEILKTEAQPYGQWETVVNIPQKLPDLQLPKQEFYYQPPVVSIDHPPPIREFKEKKITLLDSECANASIVFKKRKFGDGNKKNVRQRIDDD